MRKDAGGVLTKGIRRLPLCQEHRHMSSINFNVRINAKPDPFRSFSHHILDIYLSKNIKQLFIASLKDSD